MMTSWMYPNFRFWSLLSLLALVSTGCETSGMGQDESFDWKIAYQRSGGLMGISELLIIDSRGQAQFTNRRTAIEINGNIASEDLNELTKLVKNLPSEYKSVLGDKRCRDCFTHTLQIVVNGKSHTARINGLLDPGAPESQLLSKLNQLKTTLVKPATTQQ